MKIFMHFVKIVALCIVGPVLLLWVTVFGWLMLALKWTYKDGKDTRIEAYNKMIGQMHDLLDTYKL